jgi:hypothetical protein
MFRFWTPNDNETYSTLVGAHARLVRWAEARGHEVHLHTGSWAGNTVSTAYTKGGDSFHDMVAYVTEVK